MEDDFKKYFGELYARTLKELYEEEQGIRPFKCGWFRRKVEERRAREEGKEYVPYDENFSDDDPVIITLKDGREFKGTWGEAKKWREENGIRKTKS